MQKIPRINNHGFTLFELMISMTIFAGLMIAVLDAVANIGIARTKSMSRITLIEELYFFSEKLASSIKDGGIIDYEEYWNRQVVGTGTATGHYITPTGFGNYGNGGVLGTNSYGSWYYYCVSGNSIATKMWTGGCLAMNNADNTGIWGANYAGTLQRYGQYGLQYTDYNGNTDTDLWDEDTNGDIRGDEDDLDIGDGPITISGSTPELYLYNPLTKERTFFRWTLKNDPGLPPGSCIYTGPTMGTGCLGNIEILRLKWLDLWLAHSGIITWGLRVYDGKIDTWTCHADWPCTGPTLPNTVVTWVGNLPTGWDNEWVKMFPDYVSVRQLSFTIYPQKDPWKSWAAPDDLTTPWFVSPFIQPYVRLQMTLGLAWEKRRLIRWDDPSIAISTTISLSHTNIE